MGFLSEKIEELENNLEDANRYAHTSWLLLIELLNSLRLKGQLSDEEFIPLIEQAATKGERMVGDYLNAT
ncbi:MAG: hypothetical protein ACREDR_30915 [Blastocatellia bacterium]